MTSDNVVILIVSVFALAYLAYTMFLPERMK